VERKYWNILWAAFIVGVTATLVQFSIPPILPILQAKYDTTYAAGALLMALFALTTLLTAVSGGFFVHRFGERAIGIYGILTLIVGVVLNFFAVHFIILLIARIIQGIGFGLVSVAAPSAIGKFIPQEKMSVAMGIWSTWIPLGSLIMFLFAPTIVSTFNISTYWVIIIIILLISVLFYGKIIPRNSERTNAEEEASTTVEKPSPLLEVKNGQIWAVALAFASFTFALFSFNTWASTYLVESANMSLVNAALVPSIISFFMIGSNLYGGVLLDRFPGNVFVFVLPPLLLALTWPLFLFDSHAVLYIAAALIGAVGGVTPTIIFASAPKLAVRPETIGIAMSIVIIGENAGILIGPEVFGFLRDITGGFQMSIWTLFFANLVTMCASFLMWRAWRKKFTENG